MRQLAAKGVSTTEMWEGAGCIGSDYKMIRYEKETRNGEGAKLEARSCSRASTGPAGQATMSVPSSPDPLPSPSKAASFPTSPVGSFRPLVRSPARPMKLGASPELSHSDRTPASRGCADPKMDNLNVDEELGEIAIRSRFWMRIRF